MARGTDTGNHPKRQVGREAAGPFRVGDTVHVPPSPLGRGTFPGGPVTVDWMSKRYFTGTLQSGERLGKTGVGLTAGVRLGQPAQPWKVS